TASAWPAMTDPGPAQPGTVPLGGTLGLRLALAFLSVALAAVALLAGLTAAFAAADVSNLAIQQRLALAKAVAAVAGAAWDRNNTWAAANLSPALDLGVPTGAAVLIRDQAGRVVVSSRGFATGDGSQSSLPIVARDHRVGTALVRSTGSGLTAADRSLQ